MSRETIVLLSNITDDSQPSTWQYGEKHIGAGYYKNGNGVHTMTFELNEFKVIIKVQATLDLNPGVNDWFDVILDSSDKYKVCGLTSDSYHRHRLGEYCSWLCAGPDAAPG